MSSLLFMASGIVVFSIILFGADIMLKRKRPVTKTVLAYVPLFALLLLPALDEHPWPDAIDRFPYIQLLLALPVCFLYANALPEKVCAFLVQLFAGDAVWHLSKLAAGAAVPKSGTVRDAAQLALALLLGGMYLYWLKRQGVKIVREVFDKKAGWAWTVFAFGPCLAVWIIPLAAGSFAEADTLWLSLKLILAIWVVSVWVLAVMAMHAKAQSGRDLDMATIVLNAGKMQADEMEKMMENSRMIRHDMKHHLHVVQMLLETDNIQEARAYLLHAGIRCDEGVVQQFCLDPAVNALLLYYHHRCQTEKINFSAMVTLPENARVDSFDLCTLLGNLLENALEACQKAHESEKQILLRGVPQGGQLLITVKNTFDGTVYTQKGHIVSRKGEEGGLGIRSIRAIAGRHQGGYESTWDENTYTASVVFRL